MKGIDIIIPVHKYDESIETLLTRCLTSVKDMIMNTTDVNVDVHIVGKSEVLPLEKMMGLVNLTDIAKSFDFIENTSELDFCSQINFAVNNGCKNDYFMIVEFDDMVTPKWVEMAKPYVDKMETCPVFLPLIEVYDIENPTMPKCYLNEIAWSSSFVDGNLGSLSTEALKNYYNFNLTGAIINKNCFLKGREFKTSIKLSFAYELLLRLSHLYTNVFVVPKIGYYHFINREDSLTSEYHKTMTQEEGAWWIQLALDEYAFIKDRKKTYTPSNK